jgi:hypothetical protein
MVSTAVQWCEFTPKSGNVCVCIYRCGEVGGVGERKRKIFSKLVIQKNQWYSSSSNVCKSETQEISMFPFKYKDTKF